MKACAARRVVGSPQPAAMRFNDGAADPQPHAGAVSFGGEKGIEDLVRLPWRQAYAGIADRHEKLVVFRSLRPDGEFPRSIHDLHGIDAVRHEVHHDLLQLHAIPHDRGKVCRQFRPD